MSLLWLLVAVLVVIGGFVGDYLLRRAAHRQRYHSGRTNGPPNALRTNAVPKP